jgi:hypothetical protein
MRKKRKDEEIAGETRVLTILFHIDRLIWAFFSFTNRMRKVY